MTNRVRKDRNIEIYERLVEAFKTDNAAEIARRLGVTRHSVYQWRDGVSAPTDDKLVLAASETGTTTDWLLTGEDKQEPNEDQGFRGSIYYEIYLASKGADPEKVRFFEHIIKVALEELRSNKKSRPK